MINMADNLPDREAAQQPLLDRLLETIKLTGQDTAQGIAARRSQLMNMLKKRGEEKGSCYSSYLYVFPQSTESLSATGVECNLDCAHCGGHYLQHMTPVKQLVERLEEQQGRDLSTKSWLISGGCDVMAGVHLPSQDILQLLSRRGYLNFHVGLARPEHLQKASEFADSVCIDMIGSNETIRQVMGLDHSVEDYFQVFDELRETLQVPVIPHIVVGLHGGKLRGEFRLLEELSCREVEAVEFLILRPTPNTEFAQVSPPDLDDVAEVFITGRDLLPEAELGLGCMRPSGRYREAVDLLAAACDFDVLVQPTSSVRSVIGEFQDQVEVWWGDQCCALYLNQLIEPLGQFDDIHAFRKHISE